MCNALARLARLPNNKNNRCNSGYCLWHRSLECKHARLSTWTECKPNKYSLLFARWHFRLWPFFIRHAVSLSFSPSNGYRLHIMHLSCGRCCSKGFSSVHLLTGFSNQHHLTHTAQVYVCTMMIYWNALIFTNYALQSFVGARECVRLNKNQIDTIMDSNRLCTCFEAISVELSLKISIFNMIVAVQLWAMHRCRIQSTWSGKIYNFRVEYRIS